MQHATQMLQRKCGCGGSCGNESQLRRSALVSKRADSNRPGGTDDPIHQWMIDQTRREWGVTEEQLSDAQIKYGCPPGQGAQRSNVTVQPVQIALDDGSSPTAAPPTAVAESLWNRCCITLNVNPATTINRTAWQTLTDTGPGTGPTTEESDLWTALGSATQINVVGINDFNVAGTISTTNRGGATTFGRGRVDPMILAVPGTIGEVVSHEIGHAMGFPGHADSAGTIMHPTGSPTTAAPTVVNATVCDRARTAPVHTLSGTAASCCKRYF